MLVEGDDGEEAGHAGHDDRGLEEPGGDDAQGEGLVLALEDREQGHGAADTGNGVDEVQETGPQEFGVVPGSDGEVRVHGRSDQDEGRQGRREGEQVEDAGGTGVIAGRVFGGAVGRGSSCGGHGLAPVFGLLRIFWVRLHLGDREEGETEVAESLQQPVQGGLVHDRASDGGGAVGSGGQSEPVEPERPPRVEAPLKADLVAAAACAGWLAHAACPIPAS